MKKNCVVNILISALLGVSTLPALALKLDLPPGVEKVKPAKSKTAKTLTVEQVNPLYPAKYTPTYIKEIKGQYHSSSKEEVFYVALDMLKNTKGDFSRKAIMGANLTERPIKIEFKDLGTINKTYSSYDALGWKRGRNLYIYISAKHSNSPAIALAALLSHEALHQDEFNSLSEETYAWTMEAAVWTELVDLYPDYELPLDSLVQRENTLKKIFERGGHTSKYIRKTVYSNDGYQKLPESSPGFEAL